MRPAQEHTLQPVQATRYRKRQVPNTAFAVRSRYLLGIGAEEGERVHRRFFENVLQNAMHFAMQNANLSLLKN